MKRESFRSIYMRYNMEYFDRQAIEYGGTSLSTLKGFDQIPTRIINAIKNGNIKNTEELKKLKPRDLLRFRNVGRKSVYIFCSILEANGIVFEVQKNQWAIIAERLKIEYLKARKLSEEI